MKNNMNYTLGKVYIFNSASQQIKDINGRVFMIAGKHTFTKIRYHSFLKRFIDMICGRSYYILDEKEIVDVGLESYIEIRCLVDSKYYTDNCWWQ